ncbi:acyltransferase family protein [Micromonosporaceae bacterium Da 78-11]
MTPTLPAAVGDQVASRPRLEVLDGLRFGAALVVVAFHFLSWTDNGFWGGAPAVVFPTAHWPASYGWLGVNLFFLISGFVICMSSWGRGLGEFFASRVARLYPAFWLSVIATTAVRAANPDYIQPREWLDVLLNLTMLHEPLGGSSVSAVYWTLWEELRFYLLFAIVVWRGVTYRRVVYFCCIWTAISVGVTAAGAGNEILGPGLDLLIPDYSPLFVGGIGCYLMYRFRPTLLLWGIVGVSFVLSLPVTMRKHDRVQDDIGHHLPQWPTVAFMAISFLLIIGVALGWFRWVRGRWLTMLGATTYPLYLLHEGLGGAALHFLHPYVGKGPLLVGVTLLVLWLSWLVSRYVEGPVGRALSRGLRDAVGTVRRDGHPAPVLPAPRRPADDLIERVSAQPTFIG